MTPYFQFCSHKAGWCYGLENNDSGNVESEACIGWVRPEKWCPPFSQPANEYYGTSIKCRAQNSMLGSHRWLQPLPFRSFHSRRGVRNVSRKLPHVGIRAGYGWDGRGQGHMDSVSTHVEPETGGGWRGAPSHTWAHFLRAGHSSLPPHLRKEVKDRNEKWQQEEKAPKSN